MALTGLGCLLLAFTASAHAFVPALVVELAMVGAGLGLFTPPNNSSVMGAAPKEHLGLSGGLLNMARSIGMSWGTAFALTLMSASLVASGANSSSAPVGAWVAAIRFGFLGLVVLSAIAAVMSAGRSSSAGTTGHSEMHPLELA
jgi:MFS family permease